MKESIKSTPYFQAYTLKAFSLSSEDNGKKNHNKHFSKVINRLRVLPLESGFSKTTSINKINIPATVHTADKNWFNNYE